MSWEFVKIYRSILGSSVSNDVIVRHIFMDLLLLADQEGRVDVAPSAIARMTGWDKAQVDHAIKALMQPDPESRTPDYDGARLIPIPDQGFGWTIVNFRRYAERGGSAERTRAYRNRTPAEPELPLGADAAPTPRTFIPPTVEQVAAEIQRLGGKYLSIDPQRFVSHYESVGWVRGKTKIKNWKASLAYWSTTQSTTPAKKKSLSDLLRERDSTSSEK